MKDLGHLVTLMVVEEYSGKKGLCMCTLNWIVS